MKNNVDVGDTKAIKMCFIYVDARNKRMRYNHEYNSSCSSL